MTELTPEQIAELRRVAATGIPYAAATNVSNAMMLALLDAYEAQRPRGAGEVPGVGARVLVCHQTDTGRRWFVSTRSRMGGVDQWLTEQPQGQGFSMVGPVLLGQEIAWLPLPPLPKGGEE